jgi:hypothetical protein
MGAGVAEADDTASVPDNISVPDIAPASEISSAFTPLQR